MIGTGFCLRIIRFGPILLAGLALLAVAGLAPAQTSIDDAVALRYQILVQQERLKLLDEETRGTGPGPVAKLGLRENPRDLLATTAAALQVAYEAALQADLAPRRRDDDPIDRRWQDLARRRAEFQKTVAAAEDQYGFRWDSRRPPPLYLTIWDGLVVAWAVVAYGLSRSRARHELRLSRRRLRRAGLSGTLALILLGFIGCGPVGEPEPTAALLAELTAKADARTAEADEQARVVLAEWEGFLRHEKHPEAADLVRLHEMDLLRKARAAALAAAIQHRLVEETQKDRQFLETGAADLTSRIEEARLWNGFYLGLRGVIILGLAWMTVSPLRRARRVRAAERQAAAQSCPRCGKYGQLKAQKVPTTDPHAVPARRIVCGVCGNEFPESYRDEPRLCFPTVGISASGKTHMLATAYNQVRLGRTLTPAPVLPLPFHREELFDAIIQEIVRHRRDAGATVHGKGTELGTLPNPVLLHVTDIDRRGPSGVLVNLFDYSGEMVEKRIDSDLLRQRAVLTDGFLLFLDPTQLQGSAQGTKRGVQLEDQINAFTRFYHDCAASRGLPPGAPVPVPVAVCMTKIDLLPTEHSVRGTILPYIQQLVTDLSPPGDVTLATIQARSEWLRQLLPSLLPGAGEGLTRQLQAQFGTRVMFFPMSSVNLNVHELMSPNPTTRSLAPFGVLEPILWLLHMYGYCVFPDAVENV